MQKALDILVLDNGANRKGLAVGREIFRLGRGRFHLTTLIEPPKPEEQFIMNAEGTLVFLDYSRVGHWRRATLDVGEPGLPEWTKKLKYLYLVGTLVVVSDAALQKCVEEIRADIPRFLAGLPVIDKPQSAVLAVPPAPDRRQSLR